MKLAKIKIKLIWIFGVFCEAVGLAYLYEHGGIMHWLAGLLCGFGVLAIGLSSYIKRELEDL